MKNVIGIDVGGSTTKIVGFNENRELIEPIYVRATDPLTSIFGAFGRFTAENSLELKDIKNILVTGVGSSYIKDSIYGLACEHVPEFSCIGKGGLYLSGLQRAIVVSMGTGTAITYSEAGKDSVYLGGTGVGGGTLSGLAKRLLGVNNVESAVELAKGGDLSKIDLCVSDISRKEILPARMTASNFGKLSDMAQKEDLALGIINLVFETIAMMAIFASRSYGLKDIVLTGNLSSIAQAKPIFDNLSELFGMNFMIPEKSGYATVIGAALSAE